MSKAQAMVLCVCNVAKLPGGTCKCPPPPLSAPDHSVFVRDMLAELARTVGDPLRPTMPNDKNPDAERNAALGDHEALARYCLLTREYLEATAGLKLSTFDGCTFQPRAADNRLHVTLLGVQAHLKSLAWPQPCQHCGEMRCKRSVEDGIDCDGVELCMKHAQSTPGGQPLDPPQVEPSIKINILSRAPHDAAAVAEAFSKALQNNVVKRHY